MSNTFEVDTEGILRTAPGVNQLAGRVGNIYSKLYGTLSSLGAPWGTDATGDAFASKYLDPAGQLLTAVAGMRDALVTTGGGVELMAEGFQRTELENVGSIEFGPGSADPSGPPVDG